MAPSKPRVGIGVCTYNRLPLLQRCTKSILTKTYGDYKLVVASDASTDKTDRWLKQQPFKSICGRSNKGVCGNKNRLLATLDAYDYIFILEDDIIIRSPMWMKWYVQTCEESGYQHFSFMNNRTRARKNAESFAYTSVISSNGTTGQLMFFTREVLLKCGGFNAEYRGHGYGHLEYSKRINYAFGYGDRYFDSLEGNMCITSHKEKTASDGTNKKNTKLYKSFKRHYKKSFDRFCYRRYKK